MLWLKQKCLGQELQITSTDFAYISVCSVSLLLAFWQQLVTWEMLETFALHQVQWQLWWNIGFPVVSVPPLQASRLFFLSSRISCLQPGSQDEALDICLDATSDAQHHTPGYPIRISRRPCAPFVPREDMFQRLNGVSGGPRCLRLTCDVFAFMMVDKTLKPRLSLTFD